ncbi:YceD family protein [Halonatronum saccharophilum]|uniref:YceD family protein n=1 Tax=Halonatronum saccharophilum TaxID=150060 RepID=UPI000484E8A4|nr:DUF177 domain-containing protein [Halonatronum saccharophilum]
MRAKINIAKIKDVFGGTMSEEFSVELESITIHGEQVSFPREIKINLTVVNDEKTYIVMGKVDILLRLPCTRCLDEFEMPMKFDFDFEISKEEVEKDQIDFKNELLHHIRLNLPMKFVCDEECEGLCPSCGKNLNKEECKCIMHKVDPRLADLEKLLNQD